MLKDDRKAYVIRLLTQKGSVSVSELSRIFHISSVSVRKLLADMEAEGTIKRIWGGAMLANASPDSVVPGERTGLGQRMLQAEAIAKEAYAQIRDGEIVFLDGGTPILRQLASLLVNGDKQKTRVCTNSLSIALEFHHAKDIGVIIIGGELKHDSLTCLGGAAREMLKGLSFDRCFLSVRHLSVERGFSTDDLQEAEVKRALLAAARTSYFLMDFSCYGSDAFSLVSPCEPGMRLITDSRMPADIIARLEATGLQVIQAPVGK